MVNSMVPSWLIVAVLATILVAMTLMSLHKFITQYMEVAYTLVYAKLWRLTLLNHQTNLVI